MLNAAQVVKCFLELGCHDRVTGNHRLLQRLFIGVDGRIVGGAVFIDVGQLDDEEWPVVIACIARGGLLV